MKHKKKLRKAVKWIRAVLNDKSAGFDVLRTDLQILEREISPSRLLLQVSGRSHPPVSQQALADNGKTGFGL